MHALSCLISLIKMGIKAKSTSVRGIPVSKLNRQVLFFLIERGFICGAHEYRIFNENRKCYVNRISITLKYNQNRSLLRDIKYFSLTNLGCRQGRSGMSLAQINRYYGIANLVLTTEKGIMFASEASRLRLGGIPLFEITY